MPDLSTAVICRVSAQGCSKRAELDPSQPALKDCSRNERSDLVKTFLLSLLLLLIGPSEAVSNELDYELQSAPRYPRSLYENGVSGVAIIEFSAHSDGPITNVKVVDSSHLKFAQSAVRAVTHWRVKPWQLAPGMPDVGGVRQELYFTHTEEGNEPHRWIRQRVRWVSCSMFNNALADFQAHSPDRVWVDMHYFAYTFKVLARSATRLKMTDEQREETGHALVAAVPQIVAACRAQPDRRYRDVLPERLRGML